MNVLLENLNPDLFLVIFLLLVILFLSINIKSIPTKIVNIYNIRILSDEESRLYIISCELFDSLSELLDEEKIPRIAKVSLDLELPNGKIITKVMHFKLKDIPKEGNLLEIVALTFFSQKIILAT